MLLHEEISWCNCKKGLISELQKYAVWASGLIICIYNNVVMICFYIFRRAIT